MSKNQNFINDPELLKLEEEFEQMKKEMEEDKKQHDFSIPKEWDDDFRAVMDEVLENKAKKKNINRRSKLAMAAGVALVLIVGNGLATETVQGNKLLDIFGKTSETEVERFEMYGTEEEFNSEVGSEDVLVFPEESLWEVYDEFRNVLKRPIFQIREYPGEYEIEVAEYDSNFNMFNIQLKTEDGWIYISHEERIEQGGVGRPMEQTKYLEVWNSHLQRKIEIYEGKNEQFYSFTIQIEKDILYVQVMSSVEVCKELAMSFVYE